jgi:hypothetical protein
MSNENEQIVTESAEQVTETTAEQAQPENLSVSAAFKLKKMAEQEKRMAKQKMLEVNKRMAQIEEKERSLQSEIQRREEAKKSMDPMRVLEENGLSYEDITNHVLNDNKPTVDLQVKKLESMVQELAGKLKEKETAEENMRLEWEKSQLMEQQSKSTQAAMELVKTRLLEASEENDVLSELGLIDGIWSQANKQYEETGEVPDFEKLASENVNRLKSEVDKLINTKFFKKHYESLKQKQPAKTPPPTKTLSNALAAQMPINKNKAGMTQQDYFNRAMDLANKLLD